MSRPRPWPITLLGAWIRLEERWYRNFPLPRGGAALRHLERLFIRCGIIHPTRVEVAPGVSLLLDPTDFIGRSLLKNFDWEPDVWAAVESALPEHGVFVDVGANIGYASLMAAQRVGPRGRVIAVEPNPRVLPRLRENIAASGVTNVTVLPFASADVEASLTFFDGTDGGNSGTSSLSADNAGPGRRALVVQARRLDDMLAELDLSRLDVLKIDVEGAEPLVLKGAQATLRRFRPRLVIEVIPWVLVGMGSSADELEQWLRQHGYDRSRLIDPHNREYWSSLSDRVHPAAAADTDPGPPG